VCAHVGNQRSCGVVIARLWSSVRSLHDQHRDLHQSTYLNLMEDREPTSHQPGARPMLVGLLLLLAMKKSFVSGIIRMFRGKACCKSPFLVTNCWCFFLRQDIGWSRSHVPALWWSCELCKTTKHTIVYPSSGPIFLYIEDEQWYNGGEKSVR
jgi:hypothetical protein